MERLIKKAKVEVDKDVLGKCVNYWSEVAGDVQAMMDGKMTRMICADTIHDYLFEIGVDEALITPAYIHEIVKYIY